MAVKPKRVPRRDCAVTLSSKFRRKETEKSPRLRRAPTSARLARDVTLVLEDAWACALGGMIEMAVDMTIYRTNSMNRGGSQSTSDGCTAAAEPMPQINRRRSHTAMARSVNICDVGSCAALCRTGQASTAGSSSRWVPSPRMTPPGWHPRDSLSERRHLATSAQKQRFPHVSGYTCSTHDVTRASRRSKADCCDRR